MQGGTIIQALKNYRLFKNVQMQGLRNHEESPLTRDLREAYYLYAAMTSDKHNPALARQMKFLNSLREEIRNGCDYTARQLKKRRGF